ncbi:MAG: CHASE2 domain-containing protein [Lentisphaerae bacterium]|jgi:signal transduction histidine kinase/CHASE2 domain-containing sensor protein|nr:CHASE2 domain-containing protein [Lentisphaerota bacterium]MBT5608935.1 CHASE2 domain-containing protein [Lentisphaerota bacterium]MBT7055594.1 CHASE2 domain-containing protein [Lentisphaerota bacterium]MBT7845553.1 CHASE2 domain-containing protein [Lentisphaerota bacterium]
MESDVVVVGITTPCVRKLGELPWPRSLYGQLIRRLKEAGARVITFDICFENKGDPEEDRVLVEAAREAGNVVLPVFCPVALKNYETGPVRRVNKLRQNFPALTDAVLAVGHINAPPSPDGKRRWVPLALEHEGNVHFSLAVESATRFEHQARRLDRPAASGEPPPFTGEDIPLNRHGEFSVNYGGQHVTFAHFPFSSVLAGAVPDSEFAGKLVVVGQTALGRVNTDVQPTPVGDIFGVFIQTTLMDNILKRDFLRRQGPGSALIIAVLLSFISYALFSRLSWWMSLIAWVGLTSGYLVGAASLFGWHSYAIEVVPALVVLMGNYLVAAVVGLKESSETVQQQEGELETILRSSRVAAEKLVVDNAPQTLVNLAGETIGADFVTLVLADAPERWHWEGKPPTRAPSRDGTLSLVEVGEFEDRFLEGLQTGGHSYFSNRVSSDSRLRGADSAITSFLSTPLVVHEETIGQLNFYNKRPSSVSPSSDFTEDDLRLVAVLAQQTALTLRNSMLGDDLAKRNQQLEEALERLHAAQEELVRSEKLSVVGNMAATIIHDIRGPMTAIMGYAELMTGRDLLAEEATRYSGTIIRQTERVNNMVQEILDFARGDSELALDPIKAGLLLGEVGANLRDELRSGDITVTCDSSCPVEVHVDREKMLRVFLNLGRNAAEAMQGKGAITIDCAVQDRTIVVSVTDDGPGIPEDIRATVFEPFVTAGKEKGTGLGLAIVKRVVENHGGEIGVESATGSGTVFRVRLPLPDSAVIPPH